MDPCRTSVMTPVDFGCYGDSIGRTMRKKGEKQAFGGATPNAVAATGLSSYQLKRGEN